MMMLVPESANVWLSSLFGAAKLSVPVNGDPSLQVTLTVATAVPGAALDAMVGLAGLKLMFKVGALAVKATSTQ